MSKKNRALKKARAVAGPRTPDGRPISRLKGPADVLAIVPYLLGFQPHESLVVIALEGPRKRFGPIFRMDLVGAPQDVICQADQALAIVSQYRFERVLIAALTADRERADVVVEPLLIALAGLEVRVEEALVADGSRWWSYLCRDPGCCDPEGTPYDVTTSPAAAMAVFEGMSTAPDRDSLRQQFAALPERQREVAEQAARLSATSRPDPPTDVPALVRRCLRDPGGLSAGEVAELALAVQPTTQRDEAWLLISRTNAEAHLDLWRTMVRQVPDRLLAPVGSLAAFAAWVTGRGVLASHALDRVLAVDPSYPLARLIGRVLEQAMNPEQWDAMRASMTDGRVRGAGHPGLR